MFDNETFMVSVTYKHDEWWQHAPDPGSYTGDCNARASE